MGILCEAIKSEQSEVIYLELPTGYWLMYILALNLKKWECENPSVKLPETMMKFGHWTRDIGSADDYA